MVNRETARALLLAAVAVFFLFQALGYPIGTLRSAGPGLFPAIIAVTLLLLSAAIFVRSRFVEISLFNLPLRKISLVIASLVSFALLSKFVNMLVAIPVLVTLASLASEDFTFKRAAIISTALCIVALVMAKGLGVQLPLY